jgi:cytochrome c-type biogenesis protein CcmH/NrfG
VIALLLAALLVQAEPVTLDASVDQDRVMVGEEVTFRLRATSRSQAPMELTVAPFTGLETVSRSERTELSLGVVSTRTTVLEVRLRAVRPGRWQLGPARVVQGSDTAEAAALVLDVSANRAPATASLNPRLRKLLLLAQPPKPGQAAVDLIVSADSVTVGDQVDVITAAWFPRDLRMQLRRPPTLQPPVIDGVWSYPQSAPAGIAVTRSIGNRWYDLFIAHQVVFPLVAGRVAIPRATLKYSTPVALQFFSQEERFALASRADTIEVRPIPDEGRPPDFAGAIGSGLRLERRVTPATAHVGEAVAVELALSGNGNIALWPAPSIEWPRSVRAYTDRVDERLTSTDGVVGGVKTFRYLAVPDSAGAMLLPKVEYAYYDLAAAEYLTVALPAATVPVATGGELAASTALPPPLLEGDAAPLAYRLGHGIPDWVWLLLLLLPPAALMLRSRLSLPRRRRPVPARADLASAEDELDALVRALVPDPDRRSGAGLAAAVRAAGADAELAARVAAARERLLARRYGPTAGLAGDPALIGEVRELVQRLGGSLRGWGVRGAVILLGLAAANRTLAAQAPSPESLYEHGSLSAAAEGFARRAEAAPAVPAHWYNLGAAYYRLGMPGRATAAWLEAARLAPRNSEIQQALRLVPTADVTSWRLAWVPPVTPEELLLIGIVVWLAGWVGWVLRPRIRERWTVLLVFGALGVAAGLGLRAWYRRPVAVVLERSTIRLSPHGLAPIVLPLESGTMVRVLRRSPGWLLVRAPGAQDGWVPDEAVAAVGG